jgi:hypothetical protein
MQLRTWLYLRDISKYGRVALELRGALRRMTLLLTIELITQLRGYCS